MDDELVTVHVAREQLKHDEPAKSDEDYDYIPLSEEDVGGLDDDDDEDGEDNEDDAKCNHNNNKSKQKKSSKKDPTLRGRKRSAAQVDSSFVGDPFPDPPQENDSYSIFQDFVL